MGKTVGTIVNVQTKAAERFQQDEEERGKNGCELEEKRREEQMLEQLRQQLRMMTQSTINKLRSL